MATPEKNFLGFLPPAEEFGDAALRADLEDIVKTGHLDHIKQALSVYRRKRTKAHNAVKETRRLVANEPLEGTDSAPSSAERAEREQTLANQSQLWSDFNKVCRSLEKVEEAIEFAAVFHKVVEEGFTDDEGAGWVTPSSSPSHSPVVSSARKYGRADPPVKAESSYDNMKAFLQKMQAKQSSSSSSSSSQVRGPGNGTAAAVERREEQEQNRSTAPQEANATPSIGVNVQGSPEVDLSDGAEPHPKQQKSFRSVHAEWVEETPEGYYCKVCRPAYLRGDLLLKDAAEKYFVGKLVGNRQQPGRKAKAHAVDAAHVSLVTRAGVDSGSARQRGALSALYDASARSKMLQLKTEKAGLLSYIEGLYFLTKEEIPHTTKFGSLLNLLYRFSPELRAFGVTRPGNATYRSTTTATDIIDSMAAVLDLSTTNGIRQSINHYGEFSVMADESTAHSTSILSVYVRHVDCKTTEVCESLLHLQALTDTKAQTIYDAINNALLSRNLPVSSIHSVSFDGCSCMSSSHQGVYGLILEGWAGYIKFIHCRSHRLQLVAKTVARDTHVAIQECIENVQSLYSLFSKSNKKTSLLKECSVEMRDVGERYRGLIDVAPTRWLSTSQAISRLISILHIVLSALTKIGQDRDYSADDRSRVKGLLSYFTRDTNIQVLLVLGRILGAMAKLSEAFQKVGITYPIAVKRTDELIEELSELNTEASVAALVTNGLRELHGSVREQIVSRRRRAAAGPPEASIYNVVSPYLTDIVAEIKSRFKDDVLFLMTMDRFDSSRWTRDVAGLVAVKLEGRQCTWKGALQEEVAFMKKDLEFDPIAEGDNFHRCFLMRDRLVALYPNHARLCSVVLCLPSSTASVERCFNLSTRIADDHRSMTNRGFSGRAVNAQTVTKVDLPKLKDRFSLAHHLRVCENMLIEAEVGEMSGSDFVPLPRLRYNVVTKILGTLESHKRIFELGTDRAEQTDHDWKAVKKALLGTHAKRESLVAEFRSSLLRMKYSTVDEFSADARKLHSMAGRLFGLENTYEIRGLVETLVGKLPTERASALISEIHRIAKLGAYSPDWPLSLEFDDSDNSVLGILNRLERQEGAVRSLKTVSRHDTARMAEVEEEYEGMVAMESERKSPNLSSKPTKLGAHPPNSARTWCAQFPEDSLIKVYECWGDMLKSKVPEMVGSFALKTRFRRNPIFRIVALKTVADRSEIIGRLKKEGVRAEAFTPFQ
ncbi:hypothetical protein Pmar_PMAR015367 [Perkinsus marinus ATCC 50983]|uniref:HAT C-terminal dimerisation domain-containing protein n=1 Tax=Perkinsus marinus (strain ATCC 50983 / TXsc) TaxID=423536 RepID=C5LGW3_PERM5|nr:hypothetical protein Pmar_PMAR015367 [Perkinsus marinus ATCC 50983]EER04030.1 hypothetical protein Pmar_PMAR015367 [Perkinsus marinus ATCC 50983]|eukprot:XP_002772214.1 hypothetical protein Pmar_PMAR015367 [Perkinsus marinus ATCC 50983]